MRKVARGGAAAFLGWAIVGGVGCELSSIDGPTVRRSALTSPMVGDVCASCEVIATARRDFPRQGRSLTVAKLVDRTTGQRMDAAYDEAGRAVDALAFVNKERQLAGHSARLGPKVSEWMKHAAQNEDRTLEFIRFPALSYPPHHLLLDDPTVQASWLAEVSNREAENIASLRTCVAAAGGVVVSGDGKVSVKAKSTARALRAFLEGCDGVVEDAELPAVKLGIEQTATKNTSATDPTWTSNGSGIVVAVIEDNRPKPEWMWAVPGMPSDGIHYPTWPIEAPAHVTTSLTVIRTASSVNSHQGNAPGATTILGNNLDSSIPWALGRGARVMNRSFFSGGSDATMAKLDYYARQSPYPLIVSGAGNNDYNDDHVRNWHHNGLIVGGASSTGDRANRSLYSYPAGSWQNLASPHNDRELPDMVAPFNVNGAWPYDTASGTSVSAPQVSGAAARLLSWNAALLGKPFALRAILQAAADKDVDGMHWSPSTSGFDGKDGTGLMNVARAMQVGKSTRQIYPFETVSLGSGIAWGSSDLVQGQGDHYYNFALPWGRARIRIVVAFQAAPDSQYTSPSKLDADIDIFLSRADGGSLPCSFANQSTGSATYDNSYEFIECHMGTVYEGAFSVRVSPWSFNRSSAAYGIAIAAEPYSW